MAVSNSRFIGCYWHSHYCLFLAFAESATGIEKAKLKYIWKMCFIIPQFNVTYFSNLFSIYTGEANPLSKQTISCPNFSRINTFLSLNGFRIKLFIFVTWILFWFSRTITPFPQFRFFGQYWQSPSTHQQI